MEDLEVVVRVFLVRILTRNYRWAPKGCKSFRVLIEKNLPHRNLTPLRRGRSVPTGPSSRTCRWNVK